MNWTFTLVDTVGTAITGEAFFDGVSQGAFSGSSVLALDNTQHTITFIPDQVEIDSVLTTVYNTYSTIIPAGYGDSILSGDPEITIIFQEVTDYEPICNFSILTLKCSTDVLVLYTVAPSTTVNLTWNFGDGTPSETTSLNYLIHKYQSFGDFTINLNIEICHSDVEIDEDGCPCRNTSVYSEAPVAEAITVLGDVTSYEVSIDYFYRGNCCQDESIPISIFVNGGDQGTTYGGLTLITLSINEGDNVIIFENDMSIITPASPPLSDPQIVVKGVSTNINCNEFAIPLIFDFSNFNDTI